MLHHAAHVIRPLLAVVRHNRGIEGKFVRLITVICRNHADFTVVTLRAADDGLVIDGARQHETVIIVGVFTDQVNAARRLDNVGGRVAKFQQTGIVFYLSDSFFRLLIRDNGRR